MGVPRSSVIRPRPWLQRSRAAEESDGHCRFLTDASCALAHSKTSFPHWEALTTLGTKSTPPSPLSQVRTTQVCRRPSASIQMEHSYSPELKPPHRPPCLSKPLGWAPGALPHQPALALCPHLASRLFHCCLPLSHEALGCLGPLLAGLSPSGT